MILRALSDIGDRSSGRERMISDWEKRLKRDMSKRQATRQQATELSHG